MKIDILKINQSTNEIFIIILAKWRGCWGGGAGAKQTPAAWCDAVQAGTVAVVSMEDTVQRLTAERAMRRNHWIAAHATQIVVAEASSGGGLATCLAQWKNEGHQVNYL